MTVDQITSVVADKKPLSKRQIYRCLVSLAIRPIGIRQRPQQYPADAADRILQALGLSGPGTAAPNQPTNGSGRAALPSMRQLRREKAKAKL